MTELEVINSLPLRMRNELETVLDRFDANKVHDLMEFMNWNWMGPDGGYIPQADEIRGRARYLMAKAYSAATMNPSGGYAATGGLVGEFRFVWQGDLEAMVGNFSIVFAAVEAESY